MADSETRKKDEKQGQERKQSESSSTGARPKTKNAGARPKGRTTPSSPEEECARFRNERKTKRLEVLCKKLKGDTDRMEKKEYANFDQISKLIAPYSSDSDYLCERYKQLYQEVRQLEIDQIRYNQLQIEHEQLNCDFKKLSTTHNKLETLCRALQNQNRELKLEMGKKLNEEDKSRKEISGIFQQSFTELSAMMEANNKERYKLHDDNVSMTKQIQILRENTKEAEGQMTILKREAELHRKIHVSDLAKVKLEAKMEKQQWEKELKIMQVKLEKSEEICAQLRENVEVLKENNELIAKRCEGYEKAFTKDAQLAQLREDLDALYIDVITEVVNEGSENGEAAAPQIEEPLEAEAAAEAEAEPEPTNK